MEDDQIRGNWWEMFGDPNLNALEERVDISNQNIAAAAANYQLARAVVKQARSQYFPLVTTNPSYTRARFSSAGRQINVSTGITTTDLLLPIDIFWEADLWGRIRNTVKMNASEAQATAADLENTRLSVQAQVATAYYQLRGQDALKQLLDETVIAFQQSLDLTKARYETGIASDQDVAQAERASYDLTVANYRETVLTAFQEVEDNLAALRILSQERQQQDAAVNSSERFLRLAIDRYKFGIDSYLNVITAQTTLLNNQQTVVNIRMQQMTASVQLIMSLGGGWSAARLPSYDELTK
jgi:outer membrane protein TolC